MKPLIEKNSSLSRRRWIAAALILLVYVFVFPKNSEAVEQIPHIKGKPNFFEIWQTTSAADYDLEPHSARIDVPPGPGVIEGGEIPYLPQALAQREKNLAVVQ